MAWCPFIADSKLKLCRLTSHIDPYLIHFHIYSCCSWCLQCVHSHVHTLYANILQTCIAATASLHCLLHLRSQTKSKCYRGATKEAPGSLASAKCFFGEYLCMEDPPKIVYNPEQKRRILYDFVEVVGNRKRSETKKYVDANKNWWNPSDLRLVLIMLQRLWFRLNILWSYILWEANDIRWHPTARISMHLPLKIPGSRRAWLPAAMARVHLLQPWNSETPVTVGWCRQMEKSWELVTSVKKHYLPNRRNLSR